ncbi:four-carbon acid sugar kinase family protein [uncultured Sphaerochaeta sp.]|uniref:four-carbon acid sugar kinase family protein n=1 Tax=uncultured Sphaerochaeta sp. TaxID=886478 RepID=UPI002A0A375D|nr:four-carbon acid sugar kinase family protein [uncultured Sphaerochaeta sp.]
MHQYLIVADDFTGANDSGLQLKRKGLSTHVTIGSHRASEESIEALVLDTESRNTDEAEASALVRSALKGLDAGSFSIVMKKIDSTLRGNICTEVMEVAAFCGAELVIVSPAFPDQGRMVEGGRLLVHGKPLLETEHGKDPRKPVEEDNLVSLFSKGQSVYAVVHQEAGAAFPALEGKTILVCDARTQEDLYNLVRLARKREEKVLYVGSAGLADALCNVQFPSRGVLGMVASLSEVTREQVRYAKEHGIFTEVVAVESLLEAVDTNVIIKRVRGAISQNKPALVVVSSVLDETAFSRSLEEGAQHGLSSDAVAASIRDSFSLLGKALVEQCEISGLFLTGGDTAFGLLEALGIQEVEILREVQGGIPLLEVPTGAYASMRIVTKAGAFGNDQAIAYSLRVLQER